MQKQITIGIAGSLILIVLLVGCVEEVNFFTCDNRFLGIWQDRATGKRNLIFYPDGTWDSTGASGTWNIEKEKIVLKTDNELKLIYNYEYTFSNYDKMLTLIDKHGESMVYLKI